MHDTLVTTILRNTAELRPRLQKWNCRSETGCLSYVQAMVRPDIDFTTQQCACF